MTGATFPDVSPAAAAHLQRILLEAEERCEQARAQSVAFDFDAFGEGFAFGGQDADEVVFRATITASEQALQVVADDSQARAWALELMHAIRDQVLEQIIRYLYAQYHSDTKTEGAFEREVLDVVRVRPQWRAFQRRLRTIEKRGAGSIAEKLTALKEEAGWTYTELSNQVKLTRGNVIKHLKGKASPKRGNRDQYAQVFGEKLGRVIELESSRPTRRKKSTKRAPKKH